MEQSEAEQRNKGDAEDKKDKSAAADSSEIIPQESPDDKSDNENIEEEK